MSKTKLWHAVVVVIACFTYSIEGFVFDGWLLGLFVAVAFLAAGWPNRNRKTVDRMPILVGILMFIAIVATVQVNDLLAQKQARRIAAACRLYQSQRGDYPKTLAELVPNFLPSVPSGKVVLGSHWRYGPRGANPRLPMLLLLPGSLSGPDHFNFQTDQLEGPVSW
jgi:hypothetical protein